MRYFALLLAVIALSLGLVCVSTPHRASAQTRQNNCCAASAAPTATPTATPLADYIWTGSNTQIYGASGVGDPQANARVDALPTDPANSAVLAAQSSANSFFNSSESLNYVPNVNASPTAPAVVVTATPGGHSPPITLNTANGKGGAGAAIPWSYTGFYLQNLCPSNCTSDNHWMVIDPALQFVYQGSGGNTNGSSFFASYTGLIDSTNLSYCAQVGDKGDNFTVAGLPGWGFILMGDDLLAAANFGTPINHPTGIVVAIGSVASGSAGVNLSQITTNSVGSCSANCFQFGDILRIKSSYNCATAGGGDARTVATCISWQRYGLVVVDLGAAPGPHSGLTAAHSDAVTSTVYNWWSGLSMSSNMELVQRGSVHC